ncbi:MAG: 4-(cytidine 5'-diphospho)-2-C-methyl-D-erythritol kinase [candidate division WOR-3 bacterium]
MEWITVPSFAKVNLGLYIKEKREDGFHSIESIFQTISLKDLLSFKLEGSQIEIICDEPDFPKDSSNLIYKAAQLFKDKIKSLGVKIKVEKRIPIGAGLGGGSSNAGVTLLTLNKLLGYPKNMEELLEDAKKLGSDVPFFLKGGTALVKGRGEEVEWVKDIPILNFLLVIPRFRIATKDAYTWWDNYKKKHLTNEDLRFILQEMQEGKKESLSKLRNSFWEVIRQKYPYLREIMKSLKRMKPINVMLSGSGPVIFAILGSESSNFMVGDIEKECNVISCHSISRKEYFTLLKQKED